MTKGERRIRTEFNPSKSGLVDQIKQKSAELIDLVETINSNDKEGDAQRWKSLAQTHYEDAAMWAVKAATF